MTRRGPDVPVLEPDHDAVWPAEFALLLGVKPSTIKHYKQQVLADGAQAPVGFPRPAGQWLRDVPASTEHQPTRRVWTPWWTRTSVDTYLRDRLPVGYQRGKDEEAPGGADPARPRTAKQLATAFEAFWGVYPRKAGKKRAAAEFAKALERADLNTLLAAAAAYRDLPGRIPKYTLEAGTWLHQDGWADE
jgi:hypothetical protein